MTVRKWAEKYCCDRGMFDSEAREVIDRVVGDTDYVMMVGRWETDVEKYPAAFLALLSIVINDHAINYIDEKCPTAWYRESFI